MEQELFELNPNPVFIFELDSLQIVKVNQAFIKKYGYREKEALKLRLTDIQSSNGVAGGLDEMTSGYKNPEIIREDSVEHISKDGEHFYVMISSHPITFKNKRARIVFIHDVTDRVEAEQKAQKAFDELSQHVNNSPLGMIKWSSSFEIIEWSDRISEIIGYSREEVLGKTPYFFQFYSEDDLQIVENEMSAIQAGEKNKTRTDIKIYRPDGKLIDLRVHASAIRDNNDQLISTITFVEEITRQKRMRLRYQRLFENANDGIFLMKGDTFIACNQQVCNIFGCTKDEILGQTPADFSPEYQPDGNPSLEQARKVIDKALTEGPQVFPWRHQKKDGTLIDTEISLNSISLDEDGGYVQAIVRDVTKQNKDQEELRRSEELFRKLFLEAPSAMVMVDTQNKVTKVNQSFEQLFGFEKDELLGRDLDQILGSDEDAPRMTEEGLKGQELYMDIQRYNKEGEKLDLLLSIIPVYLDDKPIAGFGIYVDISDQKRYERELKRSLDEKQVLLEEIHHRVKNNLAIVSGLLQMQMLSVEEPRLTSYLQDSQLRIKSMAIVHEMLYQSEKLSQINMDSYVKKLVRVISNTLSPENKNIQVEVKCNECTLNINQAIPCALNINELITNSFEYAFKGRQKGLIEVKVIEKEGVITVEVKDDGVGLADNFDELRKTSLGISLIENLVKQLDANLDIDTGEWGTAISFSFNKADVGGSSSSGRV
ncbi:PAS domain S-box protein [Fodinibius salsisoli]|uniref:histidine kinase n=1 Tax=Fodinibius salsisoli TaxID=2820877 RepID=A0ABT3PSQ6_9BACT|nr:PAS domain S-box protein [Fodinibius salsisoli]MCW9708866.1 PAS domain S-box protein [Fodinibius salsisoli]